VVPTHAQKDAQPPAGGVQAGRASGKAHVGLKLGVGSLQTV